MKQLIRWHRLPDAQTVAEETVQRVLGAAQQSVQARGVFKIVLAGGSTPQKAYQLLSDSDADWSSWRVYFGDERCLPPEHVDRNSIMVSEAWLNQGQVPASQIFPIPADQGGAPGAGGYEMIIRDAVPFDVVLLGMGEDGHTASLFPGQAHDPQRLVVPVSHAPKPPPDRISLNYSALRQTRKMLVLVTGAGKHEAVARWRKGELLPVAQLECAAGIDVLIDEAAWCE